MFPLPPRDPTLAELTGSFSQAMSVWAKAGFKIVSRENLTAVCRFAKNVNFGTRRLAWVWGNVKNVFAQNSSIGLQLPGVRIHPAAGSSRLRLRWLETCLVRPPVPKLTTSVIWWLFG